VAAAPGVVAALQAKLLDPGTSLPDKYRVLFALRGAAGAQAGAALLRGAAPRPCARLSDRNGALPVRGLCRVALSRRLLYRSSSLPVHAHGSVCGSGEAAAWRPPALTAGSRAQAWRMRQRCSGTRSPTAWASARTRPRLAR